MENETLYKQLRNLPSRKSPKFMEWVKRKHPEREIHHCLGSMTGIKLNDLLVMPVTREQHEKAERNKIDFCVEHLPQSLNLLFEYIGELEK